MRQIAKLILACSFLLISTPLIAQEATSEAEGWQVVERCLAELPIPPIPQSEWDFEDMIFTRDQVGIHALRTDVPTPYIIAFGNSDTSFVRSGSFSPDGRWFAYPIGHSFQEVTSTWYSVAEHIQVVSTETSREHFQAGDVYYAIANVELPQVLWLDNHRIYYPPYTSSGEAIFDISTGEAFVWNEQVLLTNVDTFPAPDLSRTVSDTDLTFAPGLYDFMADTFVQSYSDAYKPLRWLPDSSGFIMLRRDNAEDYAFTDSQMILFDRDGNQTEVISTLGRFSSTSFSPNGTELAFIARNRLFLADMETHIVNDLCLELPVEAEVELVWSPNSNYLAFTHDGYPILLNTETLEMQILRYETGEIIGWYPLN